MTTKEIYRKYEEVFILVMEAAGEETNNQAYKDVERILKDKVFAKSINQAIEDEAPIQVFISLCIVALLKEIHGVVELSDMTEDETYELADYIFQHYLRKPTRKFTSTYGLPVINSLGIYFRFIKVGD